MSHNLNRTRIGRVKCRSQSRLKDLLKAKWYLDSYSVWPSTCINSRASFLYLRGKKNTYFWHGRPCEIIHPYRTITTLAILSSSLTQYYCVMSDNLFTLLREPHQQYLMVFPLNKIMTMCDNLLNQILVTIRIIRIFFLKCMIALMIRIWLNKLSHIAQYYWVGGLLNIIDMVE